MTTEIQQLAEVLDRHLRDEERLEADGVPRKDRRRVAAASGAHAIQGAIEATPIKNDVDALIATAMLGRLVIGELKDDELSESSERRLLSNLLAYLESKTGRAVADVCRGLGDSRIAGFVSFAKSQGGTHANAY